MARTRHSKHWFENCARGNGRGRHAKPGVVRNTIYADRSCPVSQVPERVFDVCLAESKSYDRKVPLQLIAPEVLGFPGLIVCASYLRRKS